MEADLGMVSTEADIGLQVRIHHDTSPLAYPAFLPSNNHLPRSEGNNLMLTDIPRTKVLLMVGVK